MEKSEMGICNHLSDLFSFSHTRSRSSSTHKKLKKNNQLQQRVEIKVKIDCEGCERKVRKSVEHMKGVSQVELDRKLHKLTVIGYVVPEKVLERVRYRTGKKAEFWPYNVPYDVVDQYPFVAGVYDKKGPPGGYVRNSSTAFEDHPAGVSTNLARATSTEVKYTTAFSDDNPNACSLM